MMKKITVVLLAAALSGCISAKTSPPIDVALVPNDCRNREAIVNWLDEQAHIPQQRLESDADFLRHRRSIRAKIWDLRYQCQPVNNDQLRVYK
jgi:hypothetical protein